MYYTHLYNHARRCFKSLFENNRKTPTHIVYIDCFGSKSLFKESNAIESHTYKKKIGTGQTKTHGVTDFTLNKILLFNCFSISFYNFEPLAPESLFFICFNESFSNLFSG